MIGNRQNPIARYSSVKTNNDESPSQLHLSHRESVFHSAKKNIINRHQSSRGLERNNRKFGFENITDASEGIILRIEDQCKITVLFVYI